MALIKLGERIAPSLRIEAHKLILHRPRNYSNYIDAYLKYTINQESTEKIHRWTAISTIAGAMERKCFLNSGYFTVFPNMYIFIIGASGIIRKSTSTGIGVELLRDLDDVRVMSERVTPASLIAQLERANRSIDASPEQCTQSAVFCYASELVVFLKEVYGSISELLTTFYDCTPSDSRKPWIYETKGDGLIKIHGPCLNILGASTSAWLTKAIPIEEMEGGFSSRVIFVVENDPPEKLVAWPELLPEIAEMKPKLFEDLQQIHTLKGGFKKTQAAHTTYEKWYREHKTKLMKNSDTRFSGYMGRKSTSVIKLAMVLSVAESNDLLFDARHIDEAVHLLDSLEDSMLDAFGTSGSNKFAKIISEVRDWIRDVGILSQDTILRRYWKDISGNELMQIMNDVQRLENLQSFNDPKHGTIFKLPPGATARIGV